MHVEKKRQLESNRVAGELGEKKKNSGDAKRAARKERISVQRRTDIRTLYR